MFVDVKKFLSENSDVESAANLCAYSEVRLEFWRTITVHYVPQYGRFSSPNLMRIKIFFETYHNTMAKRKKAAKKVAKKAKKAKKAAPKKKASRRRR